MALLNKRRCFCNNFYLVVCCLFGLLTPSLQADGLPYRVRVVDIDSSLVPVLEDGRRLLLIGSYSPLGLAAESDQQALEDYYQKHLVGQRLILEYDKEKQNIRGALLAYAFEDSLQPRLINAQVIRQGLTVALLMHPNLKYAEQLAEAERQAQFAGIGIWKNQQFTGQLVMVRYQKVEVGMIEQEQPALRLDDGSVITLWPRPIYRLAFFDDWYRHLGKEVVAVGRLKRAPIPMGPPPPYLLLQSIE